MQNHTALLNEQTRSWILHSAGSGRPASVKSVRRLYGGISSIMLSVSLLVDGEPREVVLRQFDQAQWLREEPDLARHEAEALKRASTILGARSPQVIAYDEFGEICGMPMVLMTKLEGAVNLAPHDMREWVDELAAALASVHRGDGTEFPWRYFAYTDVNQLKGMPWSRVPSMWQQAIAIVRGEMPAYRPCFIHRDYHPTNVLWQDGKVSGVVDWVNACQGPAGIDVGHCRVNLAQLYGVSAADAFLAAYRKHAGDAFTYDPYWDLRCLMDMGGDEEPGVYSGWTALGVTGLSNQLIMERMDEYVESLL